MLALWETYTSLYGPFGERRADVRAAQVCQMLAAVNGTKEKLTSFLLDFNPDHAPDPIEQLWAWAKSKAKPPETT